MVIIHNRHNNLSELNTLTQYEFFHAILHKLVYKRVCVRCGSIPTKQEFVVFCPNCKARLEDCRTVLDVLRVVQNRESKGSQPNFGIVALNRFYFKYFQTLGFSTYDFYHYAKATLDRTNHSVRPNVDAHKYLFINELFGGYTSSYNIFITKVEKINNKEQMTRSFDEFKNDLNWDESNTIVIKLKNILLDSLPNE